MISSRPLYSKTVMFRPTSRSPPRGTIRRGPDQCLPGLMVLREEHAAGDDAQPAGVLEGGHVAADFAEPPEGDDPQRAGFGGCGRAELGVGVTHRSSALK